MRRRALHSLFAGSAGNLIEWYDWYVYAAFSIYFAASFFPSGDLTAQLLNTAGIFAVGFLARPLGGWLLGWYADRRGRKAALTLSVWMMCGGSLMIATIPGYATIGTAAPILLMIARLLQGLSVGGEYGTSATYLSEIAEPRRRGFYSSFQYVTLILGQLLALATLLLLQRVLTEAQLESWGWRIPFAMGACGAVVTAWLRRNMAESAAFESAAHHEVKRPLRELARHPRELCIVLGLTIGGTVCFYTYTTYAQKFLVNTAGFSRDVATAVCALALFVFMFLQPIVGALSDRIGRRPVLIAFGIGAVLATTPIMTALGSASSPLQAFLLVLALLVIVSGYTAVNAIVKAELFPTHVRALGVGLPYAIAVAVFGGTAEYVALWFKSVGNEAGYYWYVTACAAVSLAVYLLVPDTSANSRMTAPEQA
jgi:MFS transporter, MHS family, alpha-ketoglutarate permease